ncbi:hydrogenase maturation nickel metallochaperone HypA [Mobiluncus mulieris]|uniref:hydrogenase maturation nickel metallochaperone HypA/HybF n=1 Tax=Mobiluncus mulieris TaxID=2052 RepID=UPI00242B9FD4|nr:hydrogenase maturation nickel metallochaperone HypA [Mobiluncus mulieris]
MHELALARSIFRIADRAAAGRAVSTIYLDVGVLRQVVPDALDFAWGCMSRQSENLAKSKLRINLVSAVITCEECGADTPIDDNLIFACATCNSTRYHVKTGEEFTLTEMDVS